MNSTASLASIFRSILFTVPALALGACSCGESLAVVEISQSQLPPNANASPTSRALNATECAALCGGGGTRECRIVEICTGVSAASCVNTVGFTPDDASVDAGPDGGVVTRRFGVECRVSHQCIGGRRPEGFSIERDDHRSVGAFLARQAALEAASMPAFEQLAQQLAVFGAPADLVERALDAVVDEFAHATTMKSLAAREGAAPPSYAQHPSEAQSLEQLATANAVEGCVRETLAALVALHQSQHATDAAIRQSFSVIAEDETRHAELSRDVYRWAAAQLDARARARVTAAMRAAIDELRDEACALSCESAEDRSRLGLPSPVAVRALIDALDQRVWS